VCQNCHLLLAVQCYFLLYSHSAGCLKVRQHSFAQLFHCRKGVCVCVCVCVSVCPSLSVQTDSMTFFVFLYTVLNVQFGRFCLIFLCSVFVCPCYGNKNIFKKFLYLLLWLELTASSRACWLVCLAVCVSVSLSTCWWEVPQQMPALCTVLLIETF